MIKNHIPNSITILNLFCGLIALKFAFNNQIEWAFFFVCLGIFFDFFDGFFARLLKVSSPLGLQLDSMADMVTSGVVPAVVMYKLIEQQTLICGENCAIYSGNFSYIAPYFGMLIAIGAALRLAKFNIDTRQTDSFIGLPTPANALFIMSLPLIIAHGKIEWLNAFLSKPNVLMAISILSAWIMNEELPLFSLKIKDKSIKNNLLPIIFLSISVILLFVFKIVGIPIIILLYIFLSFIKNIQRKKI